MEKISEEAFKAKMIATYVTNANAEWQKAVLEASIKGNALPEYPREMQLKALMQAELVAVSKHGLFGRKMQQKSDQAPAMQNDDNKTAPPVPTNPKPRSS